MEIIQESEKVWVIASSYTCVWKNSVLWGGGGGIGVEIFNIMYQF